MFRLNLGRRLTATILLLLVGLAGTCLLVLFFSQRQAQTLVADRLMVSATQSLERQEADAAVVRNESLRHAEVALMDKLQGMAALVAGASATAMITEDFGVVEILCQQAVLDPDAVWCFVTKPSERLAAESIDAKQVHILASANIPAKADFAARFAALSQNSELMMVASPIILDGKSLGKVTIVASVDRLQGERNAITERFTKIAATSKTDADNLKASLLTAQEMSGFRLLMTISVVSAIAVCVGFVITLHLTRGITRPILSVNQVATALAGGDLTQQVAIRRKDEIGSMSTALNAGLNHLRQLVQGISATANALGEASDHLGGIHQRLTREADTSADQARQVSGSTREMSQTLDSLSAGITEMGSTVDEIARSAQQAADVGQEAAQITGQTKQMIAHLNTAASEVRGIVQTISSIAQKTNLLALNAAIEAASAGEAGRGFAVVANEVKNLARQTAEATVDIESKVVAICARSDEANIAIARIAEISERINQLQQAIASAVTQQAATARELSTNVHQAAGNSAAIETSIGRVVDAAAATTTVAIQTSDQAEKLAQLAAELRTAVSRFNY